MSPDEFDEEMSNHINCPYCGAKISKYASTCLFCGRTLDSANSHNAGRKSSAPDPTTDKNESMIEETSADVRVEKTSISEEEAIERRHRTHYTNQECPFDVGDVVYLTVNGEEKALRLVEAAFTTQLASGFFAIDLDDENSGRDPADPDQELEDAAYFFEVYVSGKAPIENLSSSQFNLFRRSVGRGIYEGKPFRVYDESDSASIEAIVEQGNRQLPLTEIVAIYRAILDLTIRAHTQKSLIFGISPWTIRILKEDNACEESHTEKEDLRKNRSAEKHTKHSEAETAELPRDRSEISRELETTETPIGEPDVGSTKIDEPNYRAVFDGLETLYPMDEMPESIPLITGFAAAEFLLGVTQMVGPQADIFSLGALLFYLVTGHVPPSSIHSQFTPALPMRNFRPEFPPGLEAVVHRATRVDPSTRYQTVRQLRNDFEHAVAQMEQREAARSNPRNYSVVRAAVDRHIGIAKGKRMPLNQDSVFCGVEETGRLALVVVADGVTRATYGRGDIASQFVTQAAEIVWTEAEEHYEETGEFDATEAIDRILNDANNHLVDYVNDNYYPFSGGLHEVMGSTAVIACIQDGLVTLATLGDSRAYLYTDIGLEQLTVDHNLWTLNVLEGALPIERARAMPFADALARCVGSFRVVDQKLETLPPEPDIHQFFLRNGDRLLISTDGLTDYAGIDRDSVEDAIHGVLFREPDPALAALELILIANRGGGGDNIGIGVIDFH